MKINKHDVIFASQPSRFNIFLQVYIYVTYIFLTCIYINIYFINDMASKLNDIIGCFLGSLILLFVILFTPINNHLTITKNELIIFIDHIIQKRIYIPFSIIKGFRLHSMFQFRLGEVFILNIKQNNLILKYYFHELSNNTINQFSQIDFAELSKESKEEVPVIYKYGLSIKGFLILLHYFVAIVIASIMF